MLDLDLELCFMRQVFSAHFIPRNNVRVSLSTFFIMVITLTVVVMMKMMIIMMIAIMTKDHFYLP